MAGIDVVKGIYEAFGRGDIPAVVGAMSPDIVWNEADDFIYADGNPYVGPDAVLAGVFGRIGAEWDGFGANIEEFVDGGDTVVALGRYSGTHKGTGKAQDTQFVHVWRVADGKAVRFQQYANTLHAARVAGKA